MEFTATESGRLDALIAAQDEQLSRSKIQKAIKEGSVTVNGKVVKKSSLKVTEGDTVYIEISEIRNPKSEITPINQHLDVLFEDDAVIVINKPAGYAVHPGHSMEENETTILHGIAYLFNERNIPFSADSTLAHRLDKPTTGCLVVVKNNNSYQHLQKQFEERTTKKKYLALVSGVPEYKEATIDSPIGRNLTDRTKMSVLQTSTSRDAKTSYRVIDHKEDCAVLECDLHTGRTHQIRVHLASIGHPILGDLPYGSPASKKVSDKYAVEGLCLHAKEITFVSPADSIEHTVEAPLSSTISAALSSTGLTV
ncbi:MAG: RluA family pseudouridine synthase [Candidatus Peribacteraceae bacterium]|nr:RNA pseudouridine synthase [bacterium]MDP6561984.1 RluA family pseudouridine synthase [Candidatus Peribacteraceae bacterium]|tara:strand:+ start:1566 stop:2495 length:930 start_codon:yes stop_codon:yes gene_type:complete